MVNAGAPSGFDPSRFELDSRADVQVGALAKRQRRRRITVGVAGVVFIGVAIGMYAELRPRADAGDYDRYPVVVRCEACGHEFLVHVPFQQKFPIKCERCGQVEARPLWQCRECGARFVPQRSGTPVRCPKCGSLEVGSAATP